MPNSISSLDTLKALFVTSFPGKLSMVRIDDRGLIYIKDKEADVSYELEDLRLGFHIIYTRRLCVSFS